MVGNNKSCLEKKGGGRLGESVTTTEPHVEGTWPSTVVHFGRDGDFPNPHQTTSQNKLEGSPGPPSHHNTWGKTTPPLSEVLQLTKHTVGYRFTVSQNRPSRSETLNRNRKNSSSTSVYVGSSDSVRVKYTEGGRNSNCCERRRSFHRARLTM